MNREDNMTEPNAPADTSGFNTCVNPDVYLADWKGYYGRALGWRSEVMERYPHHLGIRYGPHPRQLMNVYWPAGAADAPTLLYFHGGGWREGHPDFYDHLAAPWVEAGAVFVSCGYRVGPERDIVAAVGDAAMAVTWWAENCRQFGADPQRITVGGHSAGGHLAAMVTLTDYAPSLVSAAGRVGGGIYMSAPLSIVEEPHLWDGLSRGNEMPDDATAALRLSPSRQVTRAPDGVVIAFGSPEPNMDGMPLDLFSCRGRELSSVLDTKEIAHSVVSLGHIDHVGTAQALGDPDGALFAAARQVVFASHRTES